MANQVWNIDPSHSTIGFVARHMVVTRVRGRFTRFSGQLVLDDRDLTRSTVEVAIETASIDTAEPQRDAHLRSADFFDAEKHPRITFRSKKVAGNEKELMVTGDLTMHGITKEVTLKAQLAGRGKDPWGNERVAFEAQTRLDRREWDLTWNQVLEAGGLLVSEKIDLELEVQAVPHKE